MRNVASILSLVTMYLVPLMTRERSQKYKIIIGAPTFKYGGIPKLSKSLKTLQLPGSYQAQRVGTCTGSTHQITALLESADGLDGLKEPKFNTLSKSGQ